MNFSSCVLNIGRSGVREIMEKSETYSDTVHFEIGNPHFTAPTEVVNEISEIVKKENSLNHYISVFGLKEFKEAVVRFMGTRGIKIEPNNVLPLPGSAIGTAICYKAFIGEAENVLIPDPCWPNHYLQTSIFNCNCIRYPLNRENDYKPTVQTLKKRCTDKTKLILINSPSNPLGSVLNKDEWKGIVGFAQERDIMIVSDEAYSEMMYDGNHVYAFTLDRKKIISQYSLSKSYGMTGWRCGFLIADAECINNLGKIAEPIYSCVSYLSLRASQIALDNCQNYIEEIRNYYKVNRDLILDFLNENSIPHLRPKGGLYIWVDISQFNNNSYEFCIKALEKFHLGLAPGSSFGKEGEGYIRIAFCRDRNEIGEGLRRFRQLLKKGGTNE